VWAEAPLGAWIAQWRVGLVNDPVWGVTLSSIQGVLNDGTPLNALSGGMAAEVTDAVTNVVTNVVTVEGEGGCFTTVHGR
jgi:hypothetical protein